MKWSLSPKRPRRGMGSRLRNERGYRVISATRTWPRTRLTKGWKCSGRKSLRPRRNRNSRGPGSEDSGSPGLELARVGAVLGREDWIAEGVKAGRGTVYGPSGMNDLAVFLVENGRGVEAEDVLTRELAATNTDSDEPNDPSDARQALTLLMEVYHRAGRPADVLALLDGSVRWGVKDLAEVYTESVTTNHNDDYAGYFAAAALAASGRAAEAIKINDALLDREGGCDPAYELMLQLESPKKAAARLDTLFSRDPFEPRPLIWKAKLLLDQGKLGEAEAAARRAISIDPSDGEQGRGRRMRVYSVLADIRAARGDAKEAEVLRGAVTAIRHSEDADRFYDAGLITRAVKMYEEALTHFSDVYCIQSRLALRLADLGDMAGAEEHYRRAYELMPDSFGRVESHCFGCERAFEGERAQSIAERVFMKLAATRPAKPQVHYLLGYLRFEQGRFEEALPEFRTAVKLDPDYLNAWKKLDETGEKVRLPAAERDAIQLNILRLDPLGRHSHFDGEGIVDLRAGWAALEAAGRAQIPDPKQLYPLAASARAIAEEEKNPSPRRRTTFASANLDRQETDPAKMVAEHPFVEDLNEAFGGADSFFSRE